MSRTTSSTAIYCRISKDREGEGLGVDRQEADCRKLAESLRLTVVQVYVDNDVSASTRSKKVRPAYNAMIKAIEAGQIAHVVAYSNSRLTRRPLELEALVELHYRTGLRINTVVSGAHDLSTADGRMQARLLGSIDAAEAERTSERTARAARQAAEAGLWHGGRRPFGYRTDGVTINAPEAAAIEEGYNRILAGETLAGIGRLWNSNGLRTGRGNQWTPNSVREALKNPRYAGLRVYRGEVIGDAEWPALIDRETWEAVSVLVNDPHRKHGPTRGRRLLTGIAVCGVCGGGIHVSGGGRANPQYRCKVEGCFSRRAAPIDEFIEQVMVLRLSEPDLASTFESVSQPHQTDYGLRSEVRVIRARLEALAVDFAEGTLTSEQVAVATTRLRAKLDQAEAELAQSLTVSPLAQFRHGDPATVWAALDIDVKRSIISTLATVRIWKAPRGGVGGFNPDTVTVEWLSAADA